MENGKSFAVLHTNISSLSKIVDHVTLIQHQFSIIGISETKIKKNFDGLNNKQLPRYMNLYHSLP